MTFWKPGAKGPQDRQLPGVQNGHSTPGNHVRRSIPQAKPEVTEKGGSGHTKDELIRSISYALEKYQTVVVVGDRGSEQIDQLPHLLYSLGWSKNALAIACTYAGSAETIAAAKRAADRTQSELGDLIGYSVKFDDFSKPRQTKLKFTTEENLLQEMFVDPLLERYAVVVLNDVHKRACYTDLLLPMLKKVLRKRTELKMIITARSSSVDNLVRYFNGTESGKGDQTISDKKHACALDLREKTSPVQVAYSVEPVEDYIATAIQIVLHVHRLDLLSGDFLVFLADEEEIESAITSLDDAYYATQEKAQQRALLGVPFHDNFSSAQEESAFGRAPSGSRKVIFASDSAENRLIPGVTHVIDSGLVNKRVFDPRSGLYRMAKMAVSRISADERASHAACSPESTTCRTFRLYTEATYHGLQEETLPEICRSDLAQLVLKLKALGVEDIVHFDWLTPPSPRLISYALEYLFALGAIDDAARLTVPLGMQMGEMPLSPSLSRALLASAMRGCSEEMLTIAAMSLVPQVFLHDEGSGSASRSDFMSVEGDAMTMLNVFQSFVGAGKTARYCQKHSLDYRALTEALTIRAHLKRILEHSQLSIQSAGYDTAIIHQCLIEGFFMNAAQLQPDGSFRSIRGHQTLWAHRSSVLFNARPKWIIFQDYIERDRLYIKGISDLGEKGPDMLLEAAPRFFTFGKSNP